MTTTVPSARRRPRRCSIALALACLLGITVQPALATPSGAPGAPTAPPAKPTAAKQPGATTTLAGNRADLFVQMLLLGYDDAAALDSVRQLTDADVAVLAAHPNMLQRAGELPNLTAAWIIGGLIIAGIVVLAIAGEGSVTIT